MRLAGFVSGFATAAWENVGQLTINYRESKSIQGRRSAVGTILAYLLRSFRAGEEGTPESQTIDEN